MTLAASKTHQACTSMSSQTRLSWTMMSLCCSSKRSAQAVQYVSFHSGQPLILSLYALSLTLSELREPTAATADRSRPRCAPTDADAGASQDCENKLGRQTANPRAQADSSPHCYAGTGNKNRTVCVAYEKTVKRLPPTSEGLCSKDNPCISPYCADVQMSHDDDSGVLEQEDQVKPVSLQYASLLHSENASIGPEGMDSTMEMDGERPTSRHVRTPFHDHTCEADIKTLISQAFIQSVTSSKTVECALSSHTALVSTHIPTDQEDSRAKARTPRRERLNGEKRSRALCEEPGCSVCPTFGFVGGTKRFCGKHKLVSLVHCTSLLSCRVGSSSLLERDVQPLSSCDTPSRGGCGPQYMHGSHRCGNVSIACHCDRPAAGSLEQEGMLDIKSKRCEFDGCNTVPTFGWPEGPRQYCGKHKEEHMVNKR